LVGEPQVKAGGQADPHATDLDHDPLAAGGHQVGLACAEGVRHGHTEQLIQDGTLAQLLPPSYWVDKLAAAGLLRPGTVLLSGTIPMIDGVNQFADGWRVEMADPQGRVIRIAYAVEQLPPAWD
jgi:hypothetical protein